MTLVNSLNIKESHKPTRLKYGVLVKPGELWEQEREIARNRELGGHVVFCDMHLCCDVKISWVETILLGRDTF